MVEGFQLFGSAHLAVLFLTVALPFGKGIAVRRWPDLDRGLEAFGPLLCVVGLLLQHIYRAQQGLWDIRWDLPMQLCDWAAIVFVLAWLTRRPIFYELGFLWGLSGTLQATITPNIEVDFPHIKFVYFHIFHSGIIIAALYNGFARGRGPRRGAVLRAWLWLHLYGFAAILTNYLTGANYGFLREKPFGDSLLNHFGPWPYYILVLEALALLSFLFYTALFRMRWRK